MKKIKDSEQLNEILESSDTFMIYKHSTACNISSNAINEVDEWEKENSDIKIYEVLVIEDRPISLSIADSYGVKHASPQLLFIKNKKCLWNISHFKITKKEISELVSANA